jgi:hypothetical protein
MNLSDSQKVKLFFTILFAPIILYQLYRWYQFSDCHKRWTIGTAISYGYPAEGNGEGVNISYYVNNTKYLIDTQFGTEQDLGKTYWVEFCKEAPSNACAYENKTAAKDTLLPKDGVLQPF